MIHTLKKTFPDGTISLRKNGVEWEAWTSGATRVRIQTDQGLVSGYDGVIRFNATDKTPQIQAGDKIEIKTQDDPDFITARVSTVRKTFDMIRINLTAEFE